MSSDFKYSKMLSKGGDFPNSFLKSGLLETSQLGLTQAEANVSSHCWKFQLNGCAQSTAEQYHRIPSVFLDKYLVYLTTVTSKHKTFSVHCWNRALAVRGGYGWKWWCPGFWWQCCTPGISMCLTAGLAAQASPSLHLCQTGLQFIGLAPGSMALAQQDVVSGTFRPCGSNCPRQELVLPDLPC